MTLDDIKTVLIALSGTYNVEYNAVTAKIWYQVLGKYTHELVKCAVVRHIETSTFPPVPADIIRICEAVLGDPANQLDPWTAWGMTQKAVRSYGRYSQERGISSLPAIVQEAVAAIGWRELCESDNQEATRAHFVRAFESIKFRIAKEESTDRVRHLMVSLPSLSKELPQ